MGRSWLLTPVDASCSFSHRYEASLPLRAPIQNRMSGGLVAARIAFLRGSLSCREKRRSALAGEAFTISLEFPGTGEPAADDWALLNQVRSQTAASSALMPLNHYRLRKLQLSELVREPMPEKGLEPPLSCPNRILSPARLPVPPPRRRLGLYYKMSRAVHSLRSLPMREGSGRCVGAGPPSDSVDSKRHRVLSL